MVSLEDDLVGSQKVRASRWFAAKMTRRSRTVPGWIGSLVFHQAQRSAERLHSRMRWDLLKYDERQETMLAFSGRGE